jgi:pimeloyl-ACP methyl ester carboxylesterase
VSLKPCPGAQEGWCGHIRRAVDPTRPRGPRLSIGFQWLPASQRAHARTLLAVEGGPGYPSTGSIIEYTGTYGPLLRTHNLLLVDQRGTGMSNVIDCPALQTFDGRSSGDRFARRVARCGRALNRRFRFRGGRHVHASDLYATKVATDDLAAVLRRLRLRKVDLYGDSYGTWFVQSFISRHQNRLRSVILDSAYPVRDLDPWYASSGGAARAAMDAVCARSAACAAAAPTGTPTARLGLLLGRLRRAPVTGFTRDATGKRTRVRVTVRKIADLVQDAGSDPTIWRELDASVRAALAGDDAPLLRLVQQSLAYNGGLSPASYFSDGLYVAVSCTDYPQLFDLRATPARRRAQFAARLAHPPAGAFDPFTAREWVTISGYSQPYDICLDWPKPVHRVPVVPRRAVKLPASIPLLVIGGDLDDLTPFSDAVERAPTLARRFRTVRLPNTVHVTSEGDTMLTAGAACARRIIRAFVRRPGALRRLNTSCTKRIPPLHTPGAFPVTLAQAAPATPAAGPDPGLDARRAATVAAQAVADATIRYWLSGAGHGPGLRGGSFTAKGDDPVRFRLRADRFAADAPARGRATWRFGSGRVDATVTVRTPAGAAVRVKLHWTQRSRRARATIGSSRLTLPAP